MLNQILNILLALSVVVMITLAIKNRRLEKEKEEVERELKDGRKENQWSTKTSIKRVEKKESWTRKIFKCTVGRSNILPKIC